VGTWAGESCRAYAPSDRDDNNKKPDGIFSGGLFIIFIEFFIVKNLKIRKFNSVYWSSNRDIKI
jgi:hypothetical protein